MFGWLWHNYLGRFTFGTMTNSSEPLDFEHIRRLLRAVGRSQIVSRWSDLVDRVALAERELDALPIVVVGSPQHIEVQRRMDGVLASLMEILATARRR